METRRTGIEEDEVHPAIAHRPASTNALGGPQFGLASLDLSLHTHLLESLQDPAYGRVSLHAHGQEIAPPDADSAVADVRQVAAQTIARRALLTACDGEHQGLHGCLAQGLVDIPVGHVRLGQLTGQHRSYHHSLPDDLAVAALELQPVEPHVKLVVVHVPGDGHQPQAPAYHFVPAGRVLPPPRRSFSPVPQSWFLWPVWGAPRGPPPARTAG